MNEEPLTLVIKSNFENLGQFFKGTPNEQVQYYITELYSRIQVHIVAQQS